jgi:hypothetical protein
MLLSESRLAVQERRQKARLGVARGESVISFAPMRLLRTLAHLVLACALIGAAIAPVRAIGFVLAPAAHGHSHMDHHASGLGAGHAARDHGTPASEYSAHKRDGCQTACCFTPAQLPARAPDATAVEFFCAVRYMDAAQPRSGRADAPEPGIPKAVL